MLRDSSLYGRLRIFRLRDLEMRKYDKNQQQHVVTSAWVRDTASKSSARLRTSRGRRYTRSETPAWSSQPIGSHGKTATGGRILQAGRCQRERVAHGSLEIRMLVCATRRCHCRSPGTMRSRTSLARPRTPRENAGTTILNDDSVQPAWPALRMGLSISQ